MEKILLATGYEKLDNAIKKFFSNNANYSFEDSVEFKKDLILRASELKPDIIILSKRLSGKELSILETILNVRTENHGTRIIYLAGQLDYNNKEKLNELSTLVMSGIYDIIHEKEINIELIKDVLEHPRKRDDMLYLLKHIKTNTIYEEEIVEIEDIEDVEDIEEGGYKNVFLVSSIKPGTGKSFVSTNLATCIARYGAKKDGKPPKVAIIEADLQNLSVGTILKIDEDKTKNLKSVMDKIGTIINKNDELVDDELKIRQVDEFIKNAFVQYPRCKNLYALVGSELRIEEVGDINPLYYIYLIEKVLEDFDVVIVDSNSSLAHITTLPLLKVCKNAYYVIDLDYNNVRNNVRYRDTLNEIVIHDKIKYVLNKDITEEARTLMNRNLVEPLEFDSKSVEGLDFDLVARIPELPIEVFLNRLFAGTPVILDKDTDYTLKARYEISKIANEIWPIENMGFLEKDYEKYKEKNTPIKKGLFSKRS